MSDSLELSDNQTWNITNDLDHEHYEEALPQAVVIVFNIIAALTILANSFHLSMISDQPRLRKPAYYNYRLFLICLGTMDLALAVVRVILSNSFFQSLLKKYSLFCTCTAVYLHLTYASMITLIVMVSIDRAYCLKQSVAYQNRKFVKRYPRIIAVVVTTFAIIYTTLGVLFNDKGFSAKDVGTCNFGSYEIPILAAPTVLLIFVYLLVITGVYVYIIILTRLHIAKSKNGKENRRITEVTKTIGAIIAGSALCWLPPIASAVLWGVGIHSLELEIYALIMLEINSLANPLLYGLANSTYRNLVYKRVSKWFSNIPTRNRYNLNKELRVKEKANGSISGTTSTST